MQVRPKLSGAPSRSRPEQRIGSVAAGHELPERSTIRSAVGSSWRPRGEAHPLADPLEQPAAERVLEAVNAQADRRLGQPQLRAGSMERASRAIQWERLDLIERRLH